MITRVYKILISNNYLKIISILYIFLLKVLPLIVQVRFNDIGS